MNKNAVLSQRLKHYRKLNDMTQAELAAIIGVESVHIANIERGRKGISLDKLVLICKRFNISLSDMLPIDTRDDSALRGKWIEEIVVAANDLDTSQLGLVRKMVCSLQEE